MCGATSYRHVIARDEHGALRPTSLYQCSGCSVVFADPKAWRDGGVDEVPPLATPFKPSQPSMLAPGLSRGAVPSAPNLATYGLTPGGIGSPD